MKTKLILIGILSILATSCCRKAYPVKEVEKVVTKTEYIEKIRIDTVMVELPQESKEIITKDTISHLTISGSISDAMVSQGLLYHSLKTDPNYKPKVIIQIKEVIKTKDSLIYVDKEVAIKMPLTKYESRMINLGWCFIGLVLCILIFTGYKIYRKFILKL